MKRLPRSLRRQAGFWNFVIPAVATAAAAWLGKEGAENTNVANANMNRETMDFNAQQAAINREFQVGMTQWGMDYNQSEAQDARAFQERMASTQYQRAVGDMQQAGLNPMLAYSQGGAASPNGAAASSSGYSGGSQAAYGNYARQENSYAAGLSSAAAALQLQNLAKQGDNIDADTALKQSQADRETASAGELRERAQNLNHQTRKVEAEIRQIAESTTNKEYERRLLQTSSELNEIRTDLENNRISEVKANVKIKEITERLLQQEYKINKPLESFNSTELGNASPAVKMLLDLVKGAVSVRSHR